MPSQWVSIYKKKKRRGLNCYFLSSMADLTRADFPLPLCPVINTNVSTNKCLVFVFTLEIKNKKLFYEPGDSFNQDLSFSTCPKSSTHTEGE